MAKRKPAPDFVENLSDEQLEAREALYLRLLIALHSQPDSPVAQNIHAKLCAVRAEQFAR